MLESQVAGPDSPVVIDDYPYEVPRSGWRVRTVQACGDYELLVTFRDGLQGRVQMKDLILGSDAGIFRELADSERFAQAAVIFGAVTWPNGADLAPDAMHDEIARNGVWVLR
jgi:hypothetical protein